MALIAAAALGACATDPMAGTWQIESTPTTEPAGCHPVAGTTVVVTIDPGGDPEVAIHGDPDHEGAAAPILDGDHLKVYTWQYAIEDEPDVPILFAYDVHREVDHLVGTAQAIGDGDTIGCAYPQTAVGTAMP